VKSTISFDGRRLRSEPGAPGRRFRADPRCFAGQAVLDAWAHVCALDDADAALPFDQPEIQQVRRDALAWWIPLLGDTLVCLTALALDSVNYGGAITVTTDPSFFRLDPFARIFPGTVVRTSLFSEVPPPAGPVVERYAGVAWPGGSF
jgi:hypothetical protein